MLKTSSVSLAGLGECVGSVAGPGIALRPERTSWTVHGTWGRVEVTGFDGSPGVLNGFGDAVNPVLADVDVEGFDGWRLRFGQHEETQPDFPVRHRVRHFCWQPFYALARGMGVEARRLSATRHPLAVRGVSGVQGSLMNHKKPNQLLRCYGSAMGIDARNKSVTYTTGSNSFL